MKHKDLFLKLAVILIAFVMSVPCAYAQDSYRIKSIYRTYRGEPNLNFYLYYQQDGRISKAETEHLAYECNESIDFSYSDDEMIIMSAKRSEGSCNWYAKPKVYCNNGRITSYESYGEDQSIPDNCTVSYDADGRVCKIECESKQYGETTIYTPEWSNSNVTKMTRITLGEYGEYVDTQEYDYSDFPNPKSNNLFSPYSEDFDAFNIPIPNNYFSNLMGIRTKNLPNHLVKSPKDEGDAPRHYNFSYVFDDFGNITEILVTDRKGDYLHFWITYETYINTSVLGLKSDERKPIAYYNSLGQKIETPEKGLNIIKYNDNTVKKVIVK